MTTLSNSIFDKYLLYMRSANNLPVLYRKGVMHDARYILEHIDDHQPLSDYITEQNPMFPLHQKDNRLSLDSCELALQPVTSSQKDFDYVMITLDYQLRDYESMRETEYSECLKNSHGDRQYCEEKFGKPNFGQLQKYLFEYWMQHH